MNNHKLDSFPPHSQHHKLCS